MFCQDDNNNMMSCWEDYEDVTSCTDSSRDVTSYVYMSSGLQVPNFIQDYRNMTGLQKGCKDTMS